VRRNRARGNPARSDAGNFLNPLIICNCGTCCGCGQGLCT